MIDTEWRWLLTHPNRAGKSTPLQQAVPMAQAGSFRPAARVRLGAVDKMFSHGDGSRGVVALAGMPASVLARAATLLAGYTKENSADP